MLLGNLSKIFCQGKVISKCEVENFWKLIMRALNRLTLQIFWGCFVFTDELNDNCYSVRDNACLYVVFIIDCVRVSVGRVALIKRYIQIVHSMKFDHIGFNHIDIVMSDR